MEDLLQHRIAQRVINLVPRLAADHYLPCAEHSQMLRRVGLLQLQFLDQLAGGKFPFAQRLDDGDAGGWARPWKSLALNSRSSLVTHTLVYSIIRMYGYLIQNSVFCPRR